MKPLAFQADEKGLELLCSVRPDVPDVVVADPTRLTQIITNLVGNALKFTSEGEVELCVALEGMENEETRLHFSVRDTGIGIPQEKQKSIFEAFSQADAATTRKFGGTGLGLTISTRLVQMMGGQIWVQSRPGAGSCFHFTIQTLARPENRAAPTTTMCLAGLPVVIVDDNASNCRILSEAMSAEGMKPTVVQSAADALSELRLAVGTDGAFRLALIDCHMPGKDGFALVEQIRQEDAIAGTILLMLTSAGQRGDAARCRSLGVAAYLTKPVSQWQLIDAVKLALEGKSDASALTEVIAPQVFHPNPSRMRILLAEDNPVNQKVAVRMLEKQGHTVIVAGNGFEAILEAQRQTFDLILMDIQMPEMDGLEATAAIRRQEHTAKHTPILALTAHAMSGDRERCLAAGMDGYVSKPSEYQISSPKCPASNAPRDRQPTVESLIVSVRAAEDVQSSGTVAFVVQGLREFLQVESKRIPGDILFEADRLECQLFETMIGVSGETNVLAYNIESDVTTRVTKYFVTTDAAKRETSAEIVSSKSRACGTPVNEIRELITEML